MSVQLEQSVQLEKIKQIVDKIKNREEVTIEELKLTDDNDDNKDTPFLYACRNSTIAVLKQVLEKMMELQFTHDEIKGQENAQGYSGLHVAIESSIDTFDKVEYLVEKYGFDVKKSAGKEARVIEHNGTYVNEFAGTPYEKIPKDVREISLEKKNNGANETRYGELTPLRIAEHHEKVEVIQYLKSKGATNSNSGGGKRTKKRKLNKRKKTQKKLKKKTRKQKKSKRKTTKRK